jgi:hypothetical protein
MVVQFGAFANDFFGEYRLRSSVWFGGNIRAAIEQVLVDARATDPSRVYIATDIPWVEAYWRFYLKVHQHEALLNRTEYVHLQSEEVPRGEPGAVMVTPIVDVPVGATLHSAGWTRRQIVADLDGKPSLALWTGSPR